MLSYRQRRFVAEYLKDQNGAQAAIRAGYSRHTAREQACDLLTRPNIKGAIDDKLRKIEIKAELTAIEVRNAVLRLMRFDARLAFNSDGTMKRIHEMPEDLLLAVSGIDSDDTRGEIKRLRFIDRVRVVELGAKILGMLKFEVTGRNGAPLIPPSPPINFTRIDDETLKRIAGITNGDDAHT